MIFPLKDNIDSCFGSKLGRVTILCSMLDLFVAGMETTSSSMMMAFLQLLHHPEVQQKVHEELDKVRFTKSVNTQIPFAS